MFYRSNSVSPVSVWLFGAIVSALLPLSVSSTPLPQTQLHGFFSQALLQTSANNLFGDSQSLSSECTEAGLNASLAYSPALLFSGQLLARRAGAVDNGQLRLDYAFADYRFRSDEVGTWGARLGRVKNPFGFYNETRDVAHTRPTILLPQSIYLDRTRQIFLSTDALYLYGEQRTRQGNYSLDLGVGVPQAGEPELEQALLYTDWQGSLRGEHSALLRLLYEGNDGQVRLAFTMAKVHIDFKAGPDDLLTSGELTLEPVILSLQYNSERWDLTAEYARQKVSNSGFGPLVSDPEHFSEFYYLQGLYRFTPSWSGVLRYDVQYFDMDDRDGRQMAGRAPLLQAAGLEPVPDHSRYAKDVTLGVRWSFSPQWMLQGEYHWVDGTSWLPKSDNPHPDQTERRWDLYLLALSYRF